MSEIKHGLVTSTYYSVVLNTSNRMMPEKLDDFLSGFCLGSLGDDWYDGHTELRDFEGVEIYYQDSFKGLFDYIASKINVDPSALGKNNIKITCI